MRTCDQNKLAAAVAKAPSLPPQAFASTSAASPSTSLPPFSADQQLNSAASHPSGNRHVTRELNRLATDLVSEEPLHKRARLSLASQPPPPSSFSSNFLSQSMPAGIDGASPAAAAGPSTGTPAATPGTPNSPFLHFLAEGKYSNVQRISFAGYLIETWYQAPYPEEFARVPEGTLHICEWCLNYMSSDFQAKRHRVRSLPSKAVCRSLPRMQTKCKMRHPPGDEIYRDGPISVFEVDGRKSKVRPLASLTLCSSGSDTDMATDLLSKPVSAVQNVPRPQDALLRRRPVPLLRPVPSRRKRLLLRWLLFKREAQPQQQLELHHHLACQTA